MPIGWKAIFLAAITPQIYWYYLMVSGLIKMLQPPQKKCVVDKEKNDSPQEYLSQEKKEE